MKPYYDDDLVTLYHGDCREVLPALGTTFEACIADPPYGETCQPWDRWPAGWLTCVAAVTRSLWCFGSLRLFMERTSEFAAAGWWLSHDKVGEYELDAMAWEKHNGSGMADRRPLRVHELAAHFYRGPWAQIYASVPRERVYSADKSTRRPANAVPHRNRDRGSTYTDDGFRAARSVVRVRSEHGRAVHPTQKPIGVVTPLLGYAVPPGGVVLDPFAGSCSTGVAAKLMGRRAVLIEADERYCEIGARRLDQGVLTLGGAAS